MKIILNLNEEEKQFHLTIGEDQDATPNQIVDMLLNGLIAVAETVVESKDTPEEQKEMRENFYDYLVITFSEAMLKFNPEHVKYKKLTDE